MFTVQEADTIRRSLKQVNKSSDLGRAMNTLMIKFVQSDNPDLDDLEKIQLGTYLRLISMTPNVKSMSFDQLYRWADRHLSIVRKVGDCEYQS